MYQHQIFYVTPFHPLYCNVCLRNIERKIRDAPALVTSSDSWTTWIFSTAISTCFRGDHFHWKLRESRVYSEERKWRDCSNLWSTTLNPRMRKSKVRAGMLWTLFTVSGSQNIITVKYFVINLAFCASNVDSIYIYRYFFMFFVNCLGSYIVFFYFDHFFIISKSSDRNNMWGSELIAHNLQLEDLKENNNGIFCY